MKKYISPSKYYELYFPDNWEYSQDDNLVSFYDNETGVGALQVSSYLIDDDYDMDIVSELSEIISEKTGMAKPDIQSKIVLLDNLANYSFTIDGRYWKYYLLFKNGKLLLITYNCSQVDSSKEANIIDKIIRSIVLSNIHK